MRSWPIARTDFAAAGLTYVPSPLKRTVFDLVTFGLALVTGPEVASQQSVDRRFKPDFRHHRYFRN
jgi:hypothetical protein